jgi:hypothetical protein
MLPAIGVKLRLRSVEGVNDQVLHFWNEISLHVQAILRVVLVKVYLKDVESDGVSVLVDAIVGSKLLQAIVSQVHIVVPVCQVVVVRTSPQVPMSVHEYFVLAVDESPHTDVKLPALKEKRPLDVLLHHTAGELRTTVNELCHLIQLREDLYSPSLVCIRRFYKPYVVHTVFNGDALLWCIAPLDIFISLIKFGPLRIVTARLQQECCWCRVEYGVACLP